MYARLPGVALSLDGAPACAFRHRSHAFSQALPPHSSNFDFYTKYSLTTTFTITTMAPVEFHRYIDGRGDTIIYKFDPVVARSPDPKWPNDTPVTVYQHYVVPKRNGIENHHSDLLPLELAVARVRADKAVSQPPVGKVMHTEDIITDDGAKAKIQYVWKGWGHGEGYRRGWATLCVGGLPATELPVKPPLTWRFQGQPWFRTGGTVTRRQSQR